MLGLGNSNVTIKYKDRTVIGVTERAILRGHGGRKEVTARIDTGATKSSIDMALAAELKLGPVIKTKIVKSASGTSLRPVVNAKIVLENKEVEAELTIADRSHMKYPLLIGQNVLKDNKFLIDPSKTID